jgi:hypothetical protein
MPKRRRRGHNSRTFAFVPVHRAQLLIIAGRAADALAPIAVALKTPTADNYRRHSRAISGAKRSKARVMAEARIGDKAAAQKTSVELEQAAATRADDVAAQTAMHFGKGQLAMASDDAATARTHFDQCSVQDQLCKWQAVIAAEKAGDKAGAVEGALIHGVKVWRDTGEVVEIRSVFRTTSISRRSARIASSPDCSDGRTLRSRADPRSQCIGHHRVRT